MQSISYDKGFYMTDFYGYSTRSISNSFFSMDVLSHAGPRIVRLEPKGTGLNLLAEVPTVHFDSPQGDFFPLGGHRLWAGPEFPEVTYLPDHLSAEVEEIPNGLRIQHESHYLETHYQRQLEVILDQAGPKAALMHQIKNLGTKPLQILPWAITQFRMGSKAHLPMAKGQIAVNEYLPNRNLVLWPYSRLQDKRFHLENTCVEIDATPDDTALKVGIFSPVGWAAIEFSEGWVLIKRFTVLKPEDYGDFNSNLQCYVKDTFIELETLGKLTTLQPGEAVTHLEEWELKKGTLASLGLD